MTEELSLDRKATLRAIWIFVKRDLKIWTYFKANFIIDIVDMFWELALYTIIALVAEESVRCSLTPYGGDYVSYIVLGIVFNMILGTSLSAAYSGTMSAFWSGRLELLMLSPISTPVFILGTSIGKYIRTFLNVAVYLIFGVFIFGAKTSATANYWLALLYIVVAAAACTGLGLMAASMIYFVDARGGQDPIRWILNVIVGLAAGVYYPLSILPEWVQWLGSLIPHTYALDACRRLLLGGTATATLPIHKILPFNPLTTNLLVLLLFAVMTLPIGWRMYNRALKMAKKYGRLSRWV